MAITPVQTGTPLSVGSGTSGTITLTGVVAGNILTIVVDDVDGAGATFTASDDQGNDWTPAVTVSNEAGGFTSAILYCLSAVSGTAVITVTSSLTTDFVAKAQEWSGGTWTLDASSSIDESTTTNHVCSATSSDIDTTGEDLVLCNSVASDGASFGTRTAGSGYTDINEAGSPYNRTMWQYQIFSTAQANERGAFTTSNSKPTAACIAAFLCSTESGGCWWPCCSEASTALYTVFFGNKAGAVSLSSVEQYSPSPADSWATMTSGTPARTNASTASLSGAAYTFGGLESSSPFYMDDNDEYVTDVWTAKTDMPSPARYDQEGMTVGSFCYSVYGTDSVGTLKDCDQYDPSGNSWANKTDAPTNTRAKLGAAGISTKGYTWGGDDALSTNLRDCEEYDPSGNSWTSKTDMPTPARAGVGGWDLSSDGYAIGGSSGASVLWDVDKYTPGSDSWAAESDMPGKHQWTGDESSGSVGYATNGQNDSSNRTLDHYGFSPSTWNVLTNCSGDARQLGSAGFA